MLTTCLSGQNDFEIVLYFFCRINVVKMTLEELDKLWSDSANWSIWWYSCNADPRIIVSKRNPKLGWTVNAAHPKATLTVLFLFILSVLFPLSLVVLEGASFNPSHFFIAVMLSGGLILAACAYLSRHPRQ